MTVSNYAPEITKDCGEVFFSHPAFVGGFGEPNGYILYINGVGQPYAPGELVKIADAGQPWQVTLKATYEGKTFEHQLGQSKGVSEVCVVVPPQPESLTRDTVTAGTPDCDSNSVPLTTINESASYYLGEDNEWHLGDWVAVGEPVLTTREATAKECPVEQVIPPLPEVPEVPEPVEPLAETPVELEPIAPKIIETGHTTQTAQPAQLAETGASDVLGGLVLAAVVLVTGGAALLRKAVV